MTSENIPLLVESLGGLHDAKLLHFQWRASDRRLEIGIDDLQANFCGLPEYAGPTKGMFSFLGVTRLSVEGDLAESGLTLYDWVFDQRIAPNLASEISLSPGGRIKVECRHIAWVEDQS